MTKKILSFLFLFLFFISFFTVINNISASTYTINIENWDSYAKYALSGSNAYVTWTNTPNSYFDFSVIDDWSISGTKSLKANVGNAYTSYSAYYGNISLNYDYPYISAISFKLRLEQVASSCNGHTQFGIEFFNKTGGRVLDCIFSRWNAGSVSPEYDWNGFGIKNAVDSLAVLNAGYYSSPTVLTLRIEHKNDPIDKNLMTYSLYNESGGLIFNADQTSNTLSSWTNFSKIRFWGFSYHCTGYSGYTNVRIDDIDLVFSDQQYHENTYCGYDMTNYTTMGEYDDSNIGYSTQQYLESTYNVPISTNIGGIGIVLSNDQTDFVFSNYKLLVNGFDMGVPSCYYTYGVNSFILFWKTNIQIRNDTINICFGHAIKSNGDYYWSFCEGSINNDLNKDGIAGYKEHSNIQLAFDNSYDGSSVYPSREINYKIYYTIPITEIISCGYIDMITTSKTTFKDEIIPIYCTASLPSENLIRLFNSTGEITISHFPFYFKGCTCSVGYYPLYTDWYRMELQRPYGTVIKSLNVTSQTTKTDYLLTTSPYPSLPFSIIDLYYRYFRTTDSDKGLITYSNYYNTPLYDILNIPSSAYNYFYIDSNETNAVPIIIGDTDVFFKLYRISNVGDATIVYTHQHKIIPNDVSENSISVSYNPLLLPSPSDSNPTGSINQIFHYKKTIILGTIKVLLNGKPIQDISDFFKGDFTYEFNKDSDTVNKNYNVSMVLYTINGTITLAYTDFNLIISSEQIPPENIFDMFTALQKLLIGFGICIGMLCIPLFIQYKAHVEIHIFIYLFFGIIGLILSTILGFLPAIVIGAIIILLVLIVTIMWLQHKTT
jgi:hypothetical protein